MTQIVFKPGKVSRLFLLATTFLTLIHSILLVFFFHVDSPRIVELMKWFDLDIEKNIPSFYSSFLLFLSSVLFYSILLLKPREQKERFDYERTCWFGLSVIFLFLSIDEAFQIHENIGDMVENYIEATGFLYFPWVLPYTLGVMILAVVYTKFMFVAVDKRTAARFILSGVLYLSGAIGFDMLGGREAELHGYDSVAYCILYTVEEFLEMLGVVTLIDALLRYIEKEFGYICINLQITKAESH